jgi:hypothetical protein
MHQYTHYKRYEDIHNSLSKANQKILQKAVLFWNGKEIKLDEIELAKLPKSARDDINILLEKSGYSSAD